MFVSFRPGDGKRLAAGLALALKECKKAEKALTALALPRLGLSPFYDMRAHLEAAESEVKRWVDEYGDAPREAEIPIDRRAAFSVAAWRYNEDTEKLRDRKEKQKRDATPEVEELARGQALADALLGKKARRSTYAEVEEIADERANAILDEAFAGAGIAATEPAGT